MAAAGRIRVDPTVAGGPLMAADAGRIRVDPTSAGGTS